eukprot:TRINITY_DN11954_c0_g1_i1.p1 TRINITY_DN11954_c0_g1~~TRINITY_DN11954_c0_g1_i1.p1  ORF type:complete len:260 (+),score=24.82 TRINITY_DN11954_c0_g1_i1:53-832(+)
MGCAVSASAPVRSARAAPKSSINFTSIRKGVPQRAEPARRKPASGRAARGRAPRAKEGKRAVRANAAKPQAVSLAQSSPCDLEPTILVSGAETSCASTREVDMSVQLTSEHRRSGHDVSCSSESSPRRPGSARSGVKGRPRRHPRKRKALSELSEASDGKKSRGPQMPEHRLLRVERWLMAFLEPAFSEPQQVGLADSCKSTHDHMAVSVLSTANLRSLDRRTTLPAIHRCSSSGSSSRLVRHSHMGDPVIDEDLAPFV